MLAQRLPLILLIVLPLLLTACSESGDEMTQAEVQYASHVDQARFFQRQGELRASTLEARSAIELQPGKADPYLIIIENLLTAGDAVSAANQARSLLESDNLQGMDPATRNTARLHLARALYMQNRPEEALAVLEKLESPDHSQQIARLSLKGDIHLAQEDPQAARKAYESALELDPGAELASVGLSRAAWMAGNREEAKALAAKAAEANPDSTEIALWRGQMAHQQGNLQAAREYYGKALEEIGKYDIMTYRKYQTMSALIDVLRKQGNAAQAMVYEEILAKSAPGTLKSNMEAASENYQRGDLQQAARHLEEVLKQAPRHERARLMLGLIRFQQGRTQEANELLSEVVDLNADPDAGRLLAATKIRLSQPEEARKILNKLDPEQKDPRTLAMVGIASLAAGDRENGEQYIRRALELKPDNTSLRLRFARYLAATNNLDAGIQQAREAIRRAPESEPARLILVTLLTQDKRYDQAEAAIGEWLKAHPGSVMALTTRGDLALARGEPERARRYYQEAAGRENAGVEPRIALYRLDRKQGRLEAALAHIQAALRQAPNNETALRALLSLMQEDPELAESSRKFLAELIQAHPQAVGPNLLLLAEQLRAGDLEKAADRASEIMKLAEDNAGLQSRLPRIYRDITRHLMAQERPDRAMEVLRQGRSRFSGNEQLALLEAGILLRRKAEDEALDVLRAVKRDHPDSSAPYELEADYRLNAGQTDQATELYRLAWEKAPRPQLAVKLANAFKASGKTDKAMEILQAARTEFPDSPQVHLALAMNHQEAGRKDEAIAAYETLLELAPENPVALNNLAWLYHEREDDRALEMARKAYELQPKSAAIADTFGWIMLQSGDVAASIPVLESAHEMAPKAKEIALHLAEAYKANGQSDKARAILEKI